MNRRYLLIALAVAMPVAVFIPAKIAASWRPVVMHRVVGSPAMLPMTMRVSDRYLVASNANATNRFDLRNGDETLINYGGIAESGDWMANLRAPKFGQMELSLNHGLQTFAYPIKDVTSADKMGYPANAAAQSLSRQVLRIEPERVELVFLENYFRWNRRSRQLEQRFPLYESKFGVQNGFREEKIAAIARDGVRVVTLYSKGIEWRDTQSGAVIQRFPLSGYRPSSETSSQIQVSPYGVLALYNARDKSDNNSRNWDVRDTETGRVSWKFALSSTSNRAVFSSDEKWLALPADKLRWEIHNAQTGAFIRSLPRVPNVSAAIFSPDNATLYSVANETLYRQRAR